MSGRRNNSALFADFVDEGTFFLYLQNSLEIDGIEFRRLLAKHLLTPKLLQMLLSHVPTSRGGIAKH